MRLAALLVGLLIVVSVGWFAAEQHYENCIDKARAEFPLGAAGLTAQDQRDEPSWVDEYANGDDPGAAAARRAAIRDRPLRRRQAALNGCSRLPW